MSHLYRQGFLLVRKGLLVDALEKFKLLLAEEPAWLADVLIPLYKRLARKEALNLRLLVAEVLVSAKAYNEALDELTDIVEQDPTCTQTYALLGKIYAKARNNRHIKRIFEQAFEQDIFDSAIIDLLPKLYLEEQAIDKSIAFYQRLIEVQPDILHYHYTLAELYTRAGRYEDAARLYEGVAQLSPATVGNIARRCERLSSLMPESIFIHHLLVSLHMKSFSPEKSALHLVALAALEPGEVETHIKICKDSLGLYPDNIEVLSALGRLLVQAGQYAEGVDCLTRVYEAMPDLCETFIPVLESVIAEVPWQVAAAELLMNSFIYIQSPSRAILMVQRWADALLQNESETPPVPGQEARLEALIQTLTQLSPEWTDRLILVLAKVYVAFGLSDKAKATCERLKYTELNTDAWIVEAELIRRTDSLASGYACLLQALVHHPLQWKLHDALQTFFQKQRQAVVAAQIDGENTLLNQGLAWMDLGKWQSAIEAFQKIGADAADYAVSQVLIGRCFLESGRSDLALLQFNRSVSAMTSKEQQNQVRYWMGVAQLQLGCISDALQSFDTILQTDMRFLGVQPIYDHFKKRPASETKGKLLAFGSWEEDEASPMQLAVFGHTQNQDGDTQKLSFAYVQNNQGVDLALKHQWAAALDEFQLALQLDPDFYVAKANRALMYLGMGKTDKAYEALSEAGGLDAKMDHTHFLKAVFACKKNLVDEALTHLQHVLAINPHHLLCQVLMGDLYIQKRMCRTAYTHWFMCQQQGVLRHLLTQRVAYLSADVDLDRWFWVQETPLPAPLFEALEALVEK
ncbi:MAG: tetratricopeptide repeat protein [Candidatus Margulisiibacteriota bacterium]